MAQATVSGSDTLTTGHRRPTIPETLQRDGIAAVSVKQVFGRNFAGELAEIRETARLFGESEKVKCAAHQYATGERTGTIKPFLCKLQDKEQFTSDDPLYQFGCRPEIKSLVNEAAGQAMRLFSVQMLCALPGSEGKERLWSQKWHRDPEDATVIKVFWFFDAVDDEAGPFEYIAGSHQKYFELCPAGQYPDGQSEAGQQAIDALPPDVKRRMTVPADTLVVTNTAGLHRGGYTKTQQRLSAVWSFVPVESQAATLYTLSEPKTIALAPPQRSSKKRTATKKIAIVGKAPSSMMLAPYDDESWEIWTITDCYRTIPRWTRYFEIHDIEVAAEVGGTPRKERWGDYWTFLKRDHGKPVYVREPHPELPHAVVFPKDKIVRKYGRYFTNSISWLLAFAIEEGATHISLFGVDMAQHGDGVQSEYAHQRPSCEYMLGVAAGRGIKIHVPDTSDLLKSRLLYGFDSDTNAMRLKWKARLLELQEQLKGINDQLNLGLAQQNVLTGLADALEWAKHYAPLDVWQAKRAGVEEQKQKLTGTMDFLVKRQHVLMGALDDMQWVRQWCET